jgi:hypothetical protein
MKTIMNLTGLALVGGMALALLGGATAGTFFDLAKLMAYMLIASVFILFVSGILINIGTALTLALHSYRIPSVLVNAGCIALRIVALYGLWIVLLNSNVFSSRWASDSYLFISQGLWLNCAYLMICTPFIVYFGLQVVEELSWLIRGPFVGHPLYRALLRDADDTT